MIERLCLGCHRRTVRDGYASKSAGFLCLSCAGRLGLVAVTTLPCGQSCPHYAGWTPEPEPHFLVRMIDLRKGMIIPSCGHTISVRVIKVKRVELTHVYVKVQSVGKQFMQEPWITSYFSKDYGNSTIWVRK